MPHPNARKPRASGTPGPRLYVGILDGPEYRASSWSFRGPRVSLPLWRNRGAVLAKMAATPNTGDAAGI